MTTVFSTKILDKPIKQRPFYNKPGTVFNEESLRESLMEQDAQHLFIEKDGISKINKLLQQQGTTLVLGESDLVDMTDIKMTSSGLSKA